MTVNKHIRRANADYDNLLKRHSHVRVGDIVWRKRYLSDIANFFHGIGP